MSEGVRKRIGDTPLLTLIMSSTSLVTEIKKILSEKCYELFDENGKLTDEEVDPNNIQEFDCAVVADKETMAACLGMKEGDKSSDDIGITMGEYEGTKAIIYDRAGNQIGVQTARSKSGPGGAMQDSIAYHKDFQRCLAKQTKIQGKCG